MPLSPLKIKMPKCHCNLPYSKLMIFAVFINLLPNLLGLCKKQVLYDERYTGSIIVPTGSKSDNLRESWHRLHSQNILEGLETK